MNTISNFIKIVLSGLDNAGKTSILMALDGKYDLQKNLLKIKPTIRIEYHHTTFLGNKINFFDMGGQKIFRKIYLEKRDIYFADTDLLVYVIDIQDKNRFEDSLEYFGNILEYFQNNDMENVPFIVSFHKYDPELHENEEINDRISDLRVKILEKYSTFKILFLQTSIYDIISIVQLVSYGLSVFDEAFFELSTLLEDYIDILQCSSLILFDQNGIIISEFYSDGLDSDSYFELLARIKEHLFLLKSIQEENFDSDYNFFKIKKKLLSYLHRIKYEKHSYYISVIIEEKKKEALLEKFSDFVDEILKIFESLFA